MGILMFFGLLFIGLIILIIGFTFLLYFIPKKLGYKKTGIILSSLFVLFLTVITLSFIFEDDLFTQNDAKNLIEEQEIILEDKFEIENNESMWAIGDYYHTFTLKISERDKIRAIDKIKNSPEFKKSGETIEDYLYEAQNRYNGPKQTQNYEIDNYYVREYYKPNGRGYAPTFRRILISKKENKLKFEDIDE